MTPDFFIRLTLATHKVADMFSQTDSLRGQIQDSANTLLASFVLLLQENPVTPEQKRIVVSRAIRQLGVLVAYLNYAKRMSQLNPKNFLVLEQEYNKVGDFLRRMHEDTEKPGPAQAGETRNLSSVKLPELNRTKEQALVRNLSQNTSSPQGELSGRQTRILEIMRHKEKVQVRELQKVLPEVTKRTLRRDLDDLLNRNLIVRQGKWNEVFYQIR